MIDELVSILFLIIARCLRVLDFETCLLKELEYLTALMERAARSHEPMRPILGSVFETSSHYERTESTDDFESH